MSQMKRQQIVVHLLRSMRVEIETTLKPELQSAFAVFASNYIIMILDNLTEWLGSNASEDVDAARRDLLAQLDGSLGEEQGLAWDFSDTSTANAAMAVAIERAYRNGDHRALAIAGGLLLVRR